MLMSDSVKPFIRPPVFLSETEIKARVKKLGEEISHDFAGQEVTAICTLKGGVVFFSDLIRELTIPLECEFMGISSYGNHTQSTGEVKVTHDLTKPLHGKHVLIVEDIVDSGLTLSFLIDHLKTRKPASIRTVALLFKPEALKAKSLSIDYIGFEIPNRFVVGYGLDYAEKHRELPYIGTLD